MTPCVPWPGALTDKGYGQISVGRTHITAHRKVMADLYGWDAIRGRNVNHHCDNRACVNPEHLYIGSQADNVGDMAKRNRFGDMRGERNGRSKLTEDQVREIRQRLDEMCTVLAVEYGVTPTLISRIRKGKSWRHVS